MSYLSNIIERPNTIIEDEVLYIKNFSNDPFLMAQFIVVNKQLTKVASNFKSGYMSSEDKVSLQNKVDKKTYNYPTATLSNPQEVYI